MQLLNHTKRTKLVFTEPLVDHVSARKAGGTGIATFAAAWEWFLLKCEGDELSIMDFDGGLWDHVKGEADAISEHPVTIGERYKDVSAQVITDLFEAERLAVPEDFPAMNYDMGVPVGFVRHLWRIWHEHGR